jgi:putative ABC transport system permease protein
MSALEGAGPTNFNIMRFDPFAVRNSDQQGPPWGRNPAITIEEANRIAGLSKLDGAIPVVDASEDVVYRGHRVTSVRIRGLGAGWTKIFKGKLVQGHNFLPADVDAAHPVAVISVQLAEELFGNGDPVGRRIRIRSQVFDVVGTITLPDNIFTNQVKHAAVVPFTASYKYLDAERDFLVISATPKDGVPQDEAMDQVTVLLRTMRGLRPGEPNNFAFVRSEEMVKTFNKLTGVFFVVMLALSSVGLMVGGVGVIAIMMIAVTERTREIGIRKALGATQREILWQFLIEAVTVTWAARARSSWRRPRRFPRACRSSRCWPPWAWRRSRAWSSASGPPGGRPAWTRWWRCATSRPYGLEPGGARERRGGGRCLHLQPPRSLCSARGPATRKPCVSPASVKAPPSPWTSSGPTAPAPHSPSWASSSVSPASWP